MTASIEQTLQDYFDGLHTSDTALLKSVFHPQAIYASATGGVLVHRTIDEYFPIVDARRNEVFVLLDRPQVISSRDLELEPGMLCVGSGAIRYRDVLVARGAEIPPDSDDRHLPMARHHARLATGFGPAEMVEPLYLRVPDADRNRS